VTVRDALSSGSCVWTSPEGVVCGHARSGHHGTQGPCLVAVSVVGGVLQPLSRQAEGKVSQGTICPCTRFTEKP
jgi:hypothetical protein